MRGAAGVTLGMVQGAAPAAPCSAARKAVHISSAVSQLERATPAALGRAPWLLLTAGTTASGVPPPPFCLQAPGRLLVPADIGPGLVGRHAELFWPDSNQWFPIVVQARHTPRCAGAPVAQGCRTILVLLLKSVCGGGGAPTTTTTTHPPTHLRGLAPLLRRALIRWRAPRPSCTQAPARRRRCAWTTSSRRATCRCCCTNQDSADTQQWTPGRGGMCRCLVRAPRLPLLATPPPLPLPTSLLPGLPAPPSHVHKATSSPSETEAVQGCLRQGGHARYARGRRRGHLLADSRTEG